MEEEEAAEVANLQEEGEEEEEEDRTLRKRRRRVGDGVRRGFGRMPTRSRPRRVLHLFFLSNPYFGFFFFFLDAFLP